MLVDGPDHAVQLGVVVTAGEGLAEVVERDLAVTAVEAISKPGESGGELARPVEREGLDRADEQPHREIDRVIGEMGTLLRHRVTPLTGTRHQELFDVLEVVLHFLASST